MKILDCTLRDGGYYNQWDFDTELVNQYLIAMENSGIDIVELGFRSNPASTFLGPFFYTSDDYLSTLNLPRSLSYAVMINGKDFINSLGGDFDKIKFLFDSKDNSPISLVRIAINFDNTLESKELAFYLKNLGYDVALNMMQSHGKDSKTYISVAQKLMTGMFMIFYTLLIL